MEMPVNIILEPNARKIVNLVLREGSYNTPKTEYGMRFFLTVGGLHDYLKDEWVKQNPSLVLGYDKEGKAKIPVREDEYLWDTAISKFLSKENMNNNFSQKLSFWNKIKKWKFTLIAGKNGRNLRGEVEKER